MNADPATRPDGAPHPSPPLVVLAAVHAGLLLASLAAAASLEHLAFPFSVEAASLGSLARHPLAVRWCAFLQLGASVPLGLFAATAASRLHFLGARAAGVAIALFGGVGASLLLALSAAVQWALGSPDVLASPSTAHALHLVSFAVGGPAQVELLGVLVAGVAVTGGIHRFLPGWMMASGLVLAAVAELSWVSLVLPAATALVPLARFPTLAWLVAAGALLPRRRKGSRATSAADRAPAAADSARNSSELTPRPA